MNWSANSTVSWPYDGLPVHSRAADSIATARRNLSSAPVASSSKVTSAVGAAGCVTLSPYSLVILDTL